MSLGKYYPKYAHRRDRMDLTNLGKWIIGTGLVLILLGGLLMASGKLAGGRLLPGDIYIHRGGFSFYFPITTCLLLSLILTLVLSLLARRHW